MICPTMATSGYEAGNSYVVAAWPSARATCITTSSVR